MQCAGCQFENMPGTDACVRCGAVLNFGAFSDVYPPRASAWQKSIRRWMPWRPMWYPVRSQLAALALAAKARVGNSIGLHFPPLPDIARAVLPGWPQFHAGENRRGLMISGVWIAAMALGALTFGSTLSAIAFGIAFAAHCSSLVDLLIPLNETTARNLLVSMAVAVLLAAAIYVPAGRTLSGYISSRRLLQTLTPFASGDVVLFRPNAYAAGFPQPGEVVLYRNQPQTLRTNTGRRNGRMRIEGEWVDRIIAGPRSRVKWQDGVLTIDGQESTLRPLNAAQLPAKLEFVVPDNACCVFPTTNPYLLGAISEANCIVHQGDILGKVIVRNYPAWRWWWINQ